MVSPIWIRTTRRISSSFSLVRTGRRRTPNPQKANSQALTGQPGYGQPGQSGPIFPSDLRQPPPQAEPSWTTDGTYLMIRGSLLNMGLGTNRRSTSKSRRSVGGSTRAPRSTIRTALRTDGTRQCSQPTRRTQPSHRTVTFGGPIRGRCRPIQNVASSAAGTQS